MNIEKPDVKRKPTPEYRFWLYDPDGDGMIYFRSSDARNKAGETAIEQYLDDGWNEDVEFVSAGEVTHFAQVFDKSMRPDDSDLDEEGCDGEGMPWPDGMEWRGNYTLAPLTPNVQIEGLAATKRERSPESSKNRRP